MTRLTRTRALELGLGDLAEALKGAPTAVDDRAMALIVRRRRGMAPGTVLGPASRGVGADRVAALRAAYRRGDLLPLITEALDERGRPE